MKNTEFATVYSAIDPSNGMDIGLRWTKDSGGQITILECTDSAIEALSLDIVRRGRTKPMDSF